MVYRKAVQNSHFTTPKKPFSDLKKPLFHPLKAIKKTKISAENVHPWRRWRDGRYGLYRPKNVVDNTEIDVLSTTLVNSKTVMDTNRIKRIIKEGVTVIGSVVVLGALLLTCFIVFLYLTNKSYKQTLATNLNFTSEWTEIRPDPPLRMRRNVAELGMTIPNYKDDRRGSFEIKLPDGRIVHPQIEVTSALGNVIKLEHSGFTFSGDEDQIIFTPKGGFLSGTTYTSVRIRSDEPFTCERLFWIERNPE